MFKLISIHNLLYIDINLDSNIKLLSLKKGYKDFWKKIIKKLYTSLLMCSVQRASSIVQYMLLSSCGGAVQVLNTSGNVESLELVCCCCLK